MLSAITMGSGGLSETHPPCHHGSHKLVPPESEGSAVEFSVRDRRSSTRAPVIVGRPAVSSQLPLIATKWMSTPFFSRASTSSQKRGQAPQGNFPWFVPGSCPRHLSQYSFGATPTKVTLSKVAGNCEGDPPNQPTASIQWSLSFGQTSRIANP